MKLDHRRAGVMLPVASLPSAFGIGDFGPNARRFVDWLQAAGQRYWQVLPLSVPDEVGSPYASWSAFAGNWMLVSPEDLQREHLLDRLPSAGDDDAPVHYRAVERTKERMLVRAYALFRAGATVQQRADYRDFLTRERAWVHDAALFAALKDHFGHRRPWTRWPSGLRGRRPSTLAAWRARLSERVELHQFGQWAFQRQWQRLRRYARRRGVAIIGDLPFFVTRDSADTWSNPANFKLDRLGRPHVVAGVPPDYFSRRGQIWGEPLFDWTHHREQRYAWWIHRFLRAFDLYDVVRLDHFSGFLAAWGVRAGSRSARRGMWYAVPGRELLSLVKRRFPKGQLIAEDLGIITDEVIKLRNDLELPGVRVLQFGFSDLGSIHALANLSRRCVAYSGTHDNNTTRGWYADDASRRERANVRRLLGGTEETVAQRMIAALYRSRANTVMVPLQDFLNLGSAARLNRPGTRTGNWRWRFRASHLSAKRSSRIRRLVTSSDR